MDDDESSDILHLLFINKTFIITLIRAICVKNEFEFENRENEPGSTRPWPRARSAEYAQRSN